MMMQCDCTASRSQFAVFPAMNDFVPLPVDDGYEGSDQLAEKANDWLKEQSHMRVINIQSLLFQKRERRLDTNTVSIRMRIA